MHVSTRTHTHKHMTAHTYIQTDIQTDTNTHTHIHDTNIGHILAFVTCLGNTYVHMRMHISTSMCASAA
jgi:hypothetical protein